MNRFHKSGIDLFSIKNWIFKWFSSKKICSILLLGFKYVLTMSRIFFSVVYRFTSSFNHTHSHPLRQRLSFHLQRPCFALLLSNWLTSLNIETFEILNNHLTKTTYCVSGCSFIYTKKNLWKQQVKKLIISTIRK